MSRDHWELLRPLIDTALELDEDSRTDWLEAQRQTNPTLAAEVEALLARESAVERSGFLSAGPVRPFRASQPGTILGPWQLERQIGHGGMGSVWLARRIDGRFDGVAAIKLLGLAVTGPEGEARFRREGSLLARLSHPNIARLLDAGVSPTGQPYLVLEHVDGTRLDHWCEQRRLDPAGRVRLFQQVVDAVAHAHASLIVHRDLKPANILVTPGGRVKLLDFGIAKLLEEGGERLTEEHSGAQPLTLDYAAPEQVCSEAISTATDVYALGVVLYQLLTGRHPTNPENREPAAIMHGIIATAPAPLPASLGPDLATVLGAALQKAPGDRYQSVAAFGDDLGRWLRHEPVSRRAPTWGYRAARFVRRHRAGVAAAVVIALALLGSTWAAIVQGRAARRERDQALVSLQRANMLADVQEVIAGDAPGANGQPASTAERLQLGVRVLEAKYSGTPWLVAEGTLSLAGRFYEMGDRDTERGLLARVQQLARTHGLPVQLATADCMRVYSFAFDEQFDSAHGDLAEAHRVLPPGRMDEPTRITCLEAEGQLLAAEGKLDSAIPLLREAVAYAAKPAPEGPGGTVEMQALNDLAQALRSAGRTREAVEYQQRIVRQLVSHGYTVTELVPNAVSYLTSSMLELGEFAGLDSILRPIIAEQEAALGPGQTAAVLAQNHGMALLRLGAYDSAETWFTRAGERGRGPRRANSGVQVYLPGSWSELLLREGRLAEAREMIRQLPDGTFPRKVAKLWFGSWARAAAGDTVGASAELEDGIRRLAEESPGSPRLALPLLVGAEWRLARGEPRIADSLATEAARYATVDSLAAGRSGYVAQAEWIRARALGRQGDLPGARAALARAEPALAHAYGAGHARVLAARALADSLGN